VAYKLELPAHSSIHPVFHVSQLKKDVGANHQVIPALLTDFAMHLAPEKILLTRSVARGSTTVPQVLVKWNIPCNCLGSSSASRGGGISAASPTRHHLLTRMKGRGRLELGP